MRGHYQREMAAQFLVGGPEVLRDVSVGRQSGEQCVIVLARDAPEEGAVRAAALEATAASPQRGAKMWPLTELRGWSLDRPLDWTQNTACRAGTSSTHSSDLGRSPAAPGCPLLLRGSPKKIHC